MRILCSNQYALEEVFDARIQSVFRQLSQIGSLYPLSPLTANLEPLSTGPFGIGSKWREHRRHLFLRDVMECEVLQCNAPYSFSVVSNDGKFLAAHPAYLVFRMLSCIFLDVHAGLQIRQSVSQASTSFSIISSSRKSQRGQVWFNALSIATHDQEAKANMPIPVKSWPS